MNAWCNVSTRSSCSPDLICSLSMWNLPQQLTKSTWFSPADYSVSRWCGVSSTGQWGLGWGKRPFIIISIRLWSWVLSQNCIFDVFWCEYNISPQTWWINFKLFSLHFICLIRSLQNLKNVCRNLPLEIPETHNYPSNSINFPKLFFPYWLQLGCSNVKTLQLPLMHKDAHPILWNWK